MVEGSVGKGDGREYRAIRAIRRVMALGFSKAEMIKLIQRHTARTKKQQAAPMPGLPEIDKDGRLQLAQWAIRTMLVLGFSESEIAEMAGVDHSTIARALAPEEPRTVGQDTLFRLMEAVQNAGAERLRLLLPRVPIKVLDTCCEKGRLVDNATRSAVEASARMNLQNALVFASSPVPLVPGIYAFLAQVGDPVHGLYLIKVPSEGDGRLGQRLLHLRLVEHEVEHLLERFREERQRLENIGRPGADLPNDGAIA